MNLRSLSNINRMSSIEYINAHIGTEIQLGQIANLVPLDVYRFIRAFSRSVGMTPHQYIIQRRIDLSKDLLRNSRLPLAVIANRCGFATPSHFTRTFRRLAGMTPACIVSIAASAESPIAQGLSVVDVNSE